MKVSIFMILFIVSILSFQNILFAQTYQSGTKDPVSIGGANNQNGTRIFDHVRYNPLVFYRGSYSRNGLYYHNPGNPNWQIGLKNELNSIVCRAAQDSFNSIGTWNGHFNPDSSCGSTAEPTEWAVGNWLNFSKSSK